ncbi:GTP cyclohydrolase I FolE [Flavobacterium sp.]|jgi:GTP cyclohydrolase I|uniref:GTP cyclohydrolase I FolE n=1 Tax=Flavobacterium sp. TaxID=239 RepID=UPI0037BF3741
MSEENKKHEAQGEMHQMTSLETPMRSDAFDKTDDQKIKIIQEHFKIIMETLGLDCTDDSLKGTPYRFAKMYVKEIFSGLNPENKPKMSVFENKYEYNKMLVESYITFNSSCEHHFLPIVGIAHVGYISSGKVIGISKINRIVQYYGKRPQVQERMTMQIFNELKKALDTEDVIVVVQAEHLCVSSRGVQDKTSFTTTIEYGGKFTDVILQNSFFKLTEKER